MAPGSDAITLIKSPSLGLGEDLRLESDFANLKMTPLSKF